MDIQRGMRDKLEKYMDIAQDVDIFMSVSGGSVYDYCCFGVDANDKLSDDRYMVFYNQVQSPAGEIRYSAEGAGAKYSVRLDRLPAQINKLVFTVSIDGSGTMGEIAAHTLSISQAGQTKIELHLNGSDFQNEKAIISIEIYKKDVWRFSAVARGFNGGLGDLLHAYGGEIAQEDRAEPSPAPASGGQSGTKVSLEKKLQQGAPHLVSLAKPLKVELEKRNLQDIVARVGLVIDISGSMSGRFRNGTVQEIVNKTLPLAVQFDDDGELDFWYYGSRCKRMNAVNMRNYTKAVPADWSKLMGKLGYGNNEPVVMREVLDEYRGSKVPAYIIFITDGGVGSEREIKNILIEASREPIFWQFVGVGGSGYGVLTRLDNMSGRYVDNANFFALDDFKKVPESELYARLLNEFPAWLKEVKRRGMI